MESKKVRKKEWARGKERKKIEEQTERMKEKEIKIKRNRNRKANKYKEKYLKCKKNSGLGREGKEEEVEAEK